MSEANFLQKEAFDEYSNNLKFDNMYNELEFYKSKCEVYEKDLFKSHTQIKKLELSIKKMQEINQANAKNNNNTSIQFFLPSEFKNNWENCVKDQILEAFENIYDNYYWLSHIVQDSVKCIYEETNSLIKEKVSSVLKLLNINENNSDNKFLPRFRTLFQEYFSSVFVFTDENYSNIKNRILNEVILSYKDFKEDIKESLIKDIESKFFKNFCQSVFKLSIYMLLHDPQLTLNIETYNKREIKYYYYIKKEHLNIEGFGTENNPCIVILFPPMFRKSFSYQGIKPAVYMIQNASDEIKKECEKNIILFRRAASNDYSNYNSNLSEKIEVGETSQHSGRNPTQQKRLTPEPTKIHYHMYNNVVLDEESPKPKINIPTSNKEKTINNNNNIKSIKASEEYPKSPIDSNTNNINQDSEIKKCYDHPLSLSKTKKSSESIKETKLLTLNNINNANINIANGVSLLGSNKNMLSNIDQKNIFSDKAARTNSQGNFKNVSRNNSIRDSSNNSLNKDSLKTSEKGDFNNSNYCPNNLINNIKEVPINPPNINKTSRIQFAHKINDIQKDIVNNQELITKNDKIVPLNQCDRKKNISNGLNKNNYIMDNNLENECGKNDLCFKVYETNKINYPLKIDQGNYATNSFGLNNFITNHNLEKNDSENSLIDQKEMVHGKEIGKSLLKFEKNRNNNKKSNYCSNNHTNLNIDNLIFKNGESYITKIKNFGTSKNEKSPGLTSSNNSACNGYGSNNAINQNTPNSNANQANSNTRIDVNMKPSVKHVVEYVNKGLSNNLNSNNQRGSIKSTTNQDFMQKNSIKTQDNSMIDNELNNCLFNNNVNCFSKYQKELFINDIKYNGPKKEKFMISNNNINHAVTARVDREKSKDLSSKDLIKESLTPKLDKYNKNPIGNHNSIDKNNNFPIPMKEKGKLFELNNNYINMNSYINSNINQNTARNTKNQFSFQQKFPKKN